VNGLSIAVPASDLSEPKGSVEEDVIESVTVDDNTDILSRCASTTTLSNHLYASMCGLVSEAVTGLRVDFGVNAIQEVITVNGLSVPVIARSLSAPSCSLAEGVVEDGAMDDSADIPAARDGMTPPIRRRAFTIECGIQQ